MRAMNLTKRILDVWFLLKRYTMRWRQITLNESQAQYSNRCCFCEYGNWHLPPFYLICTKKTRHTVHPHLLSLCMKYDAHSKNNFQFYNSDHCFIVNLELINIISFLYYLSTDTDFVELIFIWNKILYYKRWRYRNHNTHFFQYKRFPITWL